LSRDAFRCTRPASQPASAPGAARQTANRLRALFAPSVDRRHRTPISGFLDRWARAARGRSRPSHRQCRWPSLPTIHPVRHNSSWLLLLMVVAAHTDHVLPFARSSHPTDSAEPQSPHLIEAGTSKPAPFDLVVVHSFSRFFRDHFELEFYVRKLAKNGVKLVSITQEMGDDPMHVMMRQIMALFDEYQSKETAKHVLRAMRENARQGFWNGSLPPIGYRV